jgi:FkbM family methyltransferase
LQVEKMHHVLDSRLADGRSVADALFEPLAVQEVEPVVVDVGARNGMHQYVIPNSYASRSTIVGFEANPEEYDKLVAHTTDAQKIGAPMSRFKHEKYFDCALWNSSTRRPFYITAGAGACTLLGEADPALTSNMWLRGDNRPYSELHTNVKKTTPVTCKRLDEVLPAGQVVDILKIDVEGAELAVLHGAQRLFDNSEILFIKTEFVFTPYYKDHPLLGHQQVLLHEHGFRLLDLDFDQAKYSRAKTSIPVSADRLAAYAGDAYFVLDPDRRTYDALRLHRIGVACLVFGFSSFGVSLLRDAALIGDGELKKIETAIARNWTSRRMRYLWSQIPHRVKSLFR